MVDTVDPVGDFSSKLFHNAFGGFNSRKSDFKMLILSKEDSLVFVCKTRLLFENSY